MEEVGKESLFNGVKDEHSNTHGTRLTVFALPRCVDWHRGFKVVFG